MIKKMLDKLKQSNGMKNVLKISSGTILGQLLSMVTLPILTRIYGATTIGIWTSVIAVANIVNSFSDLGMSGAVMIGEDDDEVSKVYQVISTIALFVAFLSCVCIIVFYLFVENDTGIEIQFFAIFVAVYVWSNQQTTNCYSWLNRKGEYNVLMKNPLINNVAIAGIAIILGMSGMIQYGYYIGCMCGQILTIIHMKSKLPKKTFTFHIDDFVSVISKYNRFVKYQLPTNTMANIKNQMPALLIQALFGTEILGYYSVTSRILDLPIRLLANSIGRVFFKTISEMRRNGLKIGEYVSSNLNRALKLAILPMIGLIAFGELFIVVLFGKEWKMAGELLSIASCQTLFNFLMMSTNGIHITLDKQKYAMLADIFQMIGYIMAFGIGGCIFENIYIAMFLMSISFIVIQIIYFCNIYEAMDISYKRYLKNVVPIFIFIIISGLLLRYTIDFFNVLFYVEFLINKII